MEILNNSKVIAALEAENARLKQLLIEAILLPNNMIPNGANEFITDAELTEAYKHKPRIESQIEKMLDDAVRKSSATATKAASDADTRIKF